MPQSSPCSPTPPPQADKGRDTKQGPGHDAGDRPPSEKYDSAPAKAADPDGRPVDAANSANEQVHERAGAVHDFLVPLQAELQSKACAILHDASLAEDATQGAMLEILEAARWWVVVKPAKKQTIDDLVKAVSGVIARDEWAKGEKVCCALMKRYVRIMVWEEETAKRLARILTDARLSATVPERKELFDTNRGDQSAAYVRTANRHRAVREGISRSKSQQRTAPPVVVPDDDDEPRNPVEFVRSREPDPADALEQKDRDNCVHSAIEHLSKTGRDTILVWLEHYDKTHKQISEILGIAPERFRQRFHRALLAIIKSAFPEIPASIPKKNKSKKNVRPEASNEDAHD